MTPAEFFRRTALPRREARLLLQHISGYTAAECLTRDGEALADGQAEALSALAARRLAGEPLAYIVGWREFYGRRLAVSPATLIPRPETEHLVDEVLARLPPSGSVWDLGTGSGALAVSIALERPDADVFASDISEAALAVARQNAQDLGAAVAFAAGSWFAAMPSENGGRRFDILVSNPPYIEAGDAHLRQGDLRFEPQNALTDFSDGLSCIRTLAAGAAAWLKPGGWLLVEHGYNQGEACRRIFAGNGWQEIATLPDLAGLDRITLGRL
ncbi:peptide chain release factor N(5)-glutamine methyltransferase [Neisseria leonii]|uniref:peptide chain release factor N(5)-glutamine methyltransferase n=1 Tax=Neisseria leonii TaxID=2995413 RepID=UPI00237B4BDE|nr:peptide chain release factor N(5)-glutamine methyltransferase [Neisseria sp. 3986]MDD9324942.1 peptide chain release factor N(5)-glutamine methyltransferase [Neisseria sp. 3986]